MSYESTYGRRRRQEYDNGSLAKYLTGWPSDSEAGKITDGSLKKYLPDDTEEIEQ